MRTHRMLHRILAGVLSALLAITPALPAYAVDPATSAATPALFVSYLNVGQGDATVIQCGGQTLMIDGGTAQQSSYIYSWLKANGITHIDYMIGTHSDADHVGGLSGALHAATVGTAFCSQTTGESDAFNDWVRYLAAQGKTITVPAAGTTFALGAATVQILGPLTFHEGDNDNSIVTKVTYGATSFLFAGDAEALEETELVNAGVDLQSTVLKVGHHGSDSSTSTAFLNKVHPQYAVISVGAGNSYGHPTANVLNRLAMSGAAIYRTDLQGTVTAISNGAAVAFVTEKTADAASLLTAGVPATGTTNAASASIAGAFAGSAVTAAAAASSAAGVTASAATQTTGTGTYVLNTNSMKFHYTTCQYGQQISAKNRQDTTMTRAEIIAAGYKACKVCKP